jgi:TPR repeat protein
MVTLIMVALTGAVEAQPPRTIGDGRATTLLAACKAGQVAKCDELAEAGARMQVGYGGTVADPVGALRVFSDLCALKHGKGCALAAHLYQQGANGVARDTGRALATYRTACELGVGGACMTVGSLLAADQKAERVRGEALVYFENGCSLNFAKSCEGSTKMRRVLGDAKYDEMLKSAREALKALSKQ